MKNIYIPIDTKKLLEPIDLKKLITKDSDTGKGNRVFCPFCQKQHSGGPAMRIKDELYNCYGCGTYGDAIDYIQQRDNVDFLEACRRLGWDGEPQDKATIQKAKTERVIRRAEEDQKRADQLDKLLAEYATDEIWLAF